MNATDIYLQDICSTNRTECLTLCSASNVTLEQLQSVCSIRRQVSTAQIVLYLLNVYFMPVIIVVGILGNLLSCVVLLGSHMRRQSSSIYLASLSIADTFFLLSLIIVWLAWVDIDLMHRPGWCQITVFVAYVSAFLSVWSVVSFTAERYIAVWHPFRRHVTCTAKRAKMIIVGLTVFAVLLYSPSIWTSTIIKQDDKSMCAPKPDLIHIANALLNVDIIITLVIPCILIVPLNICIVFKIYKTLRSNAALHADAEGSTMELKKSCNESIAASSSSDRGKDDRRTDSHTYPRPIKRKDTTSSIASSERSKTSLRRTTSSTRTALQRRTDSQLKTTRTLVIISSFFVILNAPSHAFRIFGFIQTLQGRTYQATKASLRGQEAMQLLYYINFSINFFLYSACAKRFRKTVKRMLKRMRYSIVSRHCQNCLGDGSDKNDEVRPSRKIQTIKRGR